MRAVDPQPDFHALEEQILEFWRENRSFEMLQKQIDGRPLFRFVDGPITANNPMGVHHAWGRTLKDVAIRFRVMNGQSCRYQNGFDCQGLWVEVEVERTLGLEGKPDIEQLGIAEFSRACRERVETYAKVITDQSIRLGQWMDWDNSYYTFTAGNILGIWHFLRACHNNGWLYRGYSPMPWCPRCGTSLSEHEMTGCYKEMEHLSVFARVPLLSDSSKQLLIWTTTPWTLTANVAAAVNPMLDYCEVSAPDWDHILILCADTLHRLRTKSAKVERTFKGEELVGERYETFLPDLPAQRNVEHRVVPWEEVDAEEGSGIVHIAPGCGREDYELGQKLGLPTISPVDEAAAYYPGFDWLTGRHATEVAEEIVTELDRTGKLLYAEPHAHSYPVCWRCKGELIFRLVGEWFISCDEIRPRMIEAARRVTWKPEFIAKRMEDWLQNMGDWCISRKRYWGMPLPFYPCGNCGQLTVVGSSEELRELAVEPRRVDELLELHRPWIDEVLIYCPSCGQPKSRIKEVGDCWLDAGIVPYSTLGYFDDREGWQQRFPITWICEMREQVRLWYYSMLFMGVTISDCAPYEEVLSYERVVAEDGTPFSKSGHMIRFDDAVEKISADAMRYLYCQQPVATELRFGYGPGFEAQRKLMTLWNIYAFFVTYAMIDRPDVSRSVPRISYQVTDRWLMARTAIMLSRVTEAYEKFETPRVLRELEAYLQDVSNWYVRVSRIRFWKEAAANSKPACYSALYTALRTTVIVFAPITPFLTESIWQNLVRSLEPDAPESIHHAAWPELLNDWRDDQLLERTESVRSVISLALRLREEASIRLRQPLSVLHVHAPAMTVSALREQEDVLRRETNVVAVDYDSDLSEFQVERLKLNLKTAGPKLKQSAGKVAQLLDELSLKVSGELVASLRTAGLVTVPGFDQELDAELFTYKQDVKPGYQLGRVGDVALALDIRVSEELGKEGLMRDLVRRIQVLRRESGLEVTQRIRLLLHTRSEEMRAVIERHRETIGYEVLAVEIVLEARDTTSAATWEIQGHLVSAAIHPVTDTRQQV